MFKVTLPKFVQRAIEEKEKVRHVSESYDYRLVVEDKERQRKRLEAEGIRGFQEIVSGGITDGYLRWRGIQATLELAKSNNTKIVIVGGKDGLPLILNTEGPSSKQLSSMKGSKKVPSSISTIGEPTDLNIQQPNEMSGNDIETLPIQGKNMSAEKIKTKQARALDKQIKNNESSPGTFLKDMMDSHKIKTK